MCAPLAEHLSDRAVGKSPVASRRRGTVLVLVVGVLVMIMLIGTALLMTTRSETARVATDKSAVDADALLEKAVDHVLDLLARDLWGLDDVLLNGNPSLNPLRPGEVYDEPYDGFSTLGLNADPADQTWEGDAWLGSTVPYFDPSMARLRWRRLSWVPLDEESASLALQQRLGVPFSVLIDNMGLPKNDAGTPETPRDSAGQLDPSFDFDWFRSAYLDADGDGIRDSVRLMRQFAGTAGQRFDLAIRIVDNGSMLNLNTASDSTADVPEDEAGRYVSDLGAEPVLGLTPGQLAGFVAVRSKATKPPLNVAYPGLDLAEPRQYAAWYVRAGLLSGWPMPAYIPADSEASLRHRHLLLPFRPVTGLGRKSIETDFSATLVPNAAQYRRYDETETTSQGGAPTWMRHMDPESSEFVLRPLVTTISKDHQRLAVPRSVFLNPSVLPAGMNLPMLPAIHPQTGVRIARADRFDLVDVNANPLDMEFVLDPSTGRVVQVDPRFPLPAELSGAIAIDPRVGYAGQLAGAALPGHFAAFGQQARKRLARGAEFLFDPAQVVVPEPVRRPADQWPAALIDAERFAAGPRDRASVGLRVVAISRGVFAARILAAAVLAGRHRRLAVASPLGATLGLGDDRAEQGRLQFGAQKLPNDLLSLRSEIDAPRVAVMLALVRSRNVDPDLAAHVDVGRLHRADLAGAHAAEKLQADHGADVPIQQR